jgi:hypothetical protein
VKNHLIHLPIQNTQEIYVQGKNPEVKLGNKRNVQMTPLNSNLQKYIESFKFETPLHSGGGKIMQFATPSSNGESITTATSMRKISHKFSPRTNVQSPAESENSLKADHLRFTPNAGTKNLMQQSLERIDNAVKRYGKKIDHQQPGPFELSNTPAVLHSQLRDYLDSEGSSLYGGLQDGQTPMSKIPQRKVMSENAADSIF